jgi:FtsP/CotA-like multicopper oxidase with cupredoxin domain
MYVFLTGYIQIGSKLTGSQDPLTDTVPYYVQTPPAEPATTTTFDITVNVNGSGNLLFYVNDVSFRTNYDYPILLLTSEGNVSYPLDPQWNVYDYGKNTSIRAIVYNYFSLPHPMHLHGHAFWVLAEGAGTWDGTVTNPSNPQRRDTHLVQPGSPTYPSYAVFEWEANNPGIWPFHCHTSIHVSSGLYVSIMVSVRLQDFFGSIC